MTYGEALAYLYSLTNYECKSTFAYAPQFFDLKRVERLLGALGNPHHKFKSVHIAGTKGKGSTSAMLASILQTAGYRTGLYTSPHLHTFRERTQVDAQYISEAEFAALAERVRPIAEQDSELTTFEVATAMAFAHFADAGVQMAVVEVGLGGRLDATNVIRPETSIITTIGHDHMHILGNTLAEIAGEKSGIIKEGVPVVTAPQQPAALAVIRLAAADKGVPLHEVSREWQWRATQCSLDGQTFWISSRLQTSAHDSRIAYRGLHIPLLGSHQLRNATVVLAAVHSLRHAGYAITDNAIRQRLHGVIWPARFEVMGTHPFFIVDGAHNVDSARSVAATLKHCFRGQRPWFVLAILSDKDIPAILRALLPISSGAFFARSRHPRVADPSYLLQQAAPYGVPAEVIEDVGLAVERALKQAGPDGLVVATGSFSTAGLAREKWLQLHNLPLPPLDPL